MPVTRHSCEGNARAFLRRRLAGGLVLALALLPLVAAAQAVDSRQDVFTIAGVPVDATAASAAAAREQARAEGQRIAFGKLLERLTLAADRNRLPKASDATLNELVRGFEVARERRSGVRYLAEYTFHFHPIGVRRFLRQANIPFAETPSKPLIVLPVLREGETAVLWDDTNRWRDAWSQRTPQPSLVPLTLPLGELADVSAIDGPAAVAGDDLRLQAIAQRYGGGDVLVAQAVLTGANDDRKLVVTATRYVPGSPGHEQSWSNTYVALPKESEADLLGRGADGTAITMEEAWKAANVLDFNQNGTLHAHVPAANLQEWIAVRDRLTDIPAVRGSDLLALGRDGAEVIIHYVGDAAQLRLALAQRDLELVGEGADWVLKRRAGAPPQQ